MGKGIKKSGSDRGGLNLDPEDKSGLVYRQTPLQAIDAAPEPSTGTNIDRHAVSAVDLLSQSMSAMVTNDANARSDHKNSQRSQSFTLHGSATNLLINGRTRKNTAGSINTTSSQKEHKRSISTPKGLDEEVQFGLEELIVSSDEENLPASSSSSSSDSYDASSPNDVFDMDSSDRSTGRRKVMSKQISSLMGSIADGSADSDDYDDEGDFQGSDVSTCADDYHRPIKCCGFHAPHCQVPVNRIASFVVRWAPCFWCFPIPISATDRTVLTRLNIISAFFCMGQMVATAWLVVVMLIPATHHEQNDDEYGITHGMQPNLWSLTGSMYAIGFFGAVIFIANLVTLKVIQVVNLLGAIRYLWVLLYLIPFEIFFVLSLFDFYDVTEVWIKHWWNVPSMAWFREVYCAPGTAGSLCMVPVYGDGEVASRKETQWCLTNYKSTNCTDIRDAAQEEVGYLLDWFYNTNVAWGFVLIMVLFLIVNTLERIISRPIVQKSRESNVPAWLSLPFLGCTAVGAVLRYSPSSVLSTHSESTYSWIGTSFMACGAMFLVSAALGWFISTFSILSGRDKRSKHVAVNVFICTNAATSLILTVIFVASISYSVALVDIPISRDQKHEIACGVDTADSCSNCDKSDPWLPKCPEWSLDDVTRVLQTQTKGSATLAVIFFLYSFSALRFGFVLRKHVTMYQIDYV